MSKELKAIEATIKQVKEEARVGKYHEWDVSSCPLCKAFEEPGDDSCPKCPLSILKENPGSRAPCVRLVVSEGYSFPDTISIEIIFSFLIDLRDAYKRLGVK